MHKLTFILCFVFFISASAQILLSISTDKARYAPDEPVQFAVTSETATGTLAITYFFLNQKIDEQTIPVNATTTTWSWQPPAENYTGYLAQIILYDGARTLDSICIAVDVSSDWRKFPRYGFLSKYPLLSQTTIDKTIARLNRYHINGLQFYDWHYKHHLPLKGTPEQPASSWQDIANRTNYFPTVAGYIQSAHERNMMAMSYNLLYGAYRDAATDGVPATWRLFKDQNHSQPDYHPLPSSWASDIYLIDPSHPNWIAHILDKTDDAFVALNFDGWHMDQLGDRGTLYTYDGRPVTLSETFAPFINETKNTLGGALVMNAVNQYGQAEIAVSPVDFLYTEVWPPNDSYSSLVSIFQKNAAWSNNSLPTVLAAYVNKAQSSQAGFFNTPAVLLADAVIFAAGGAHLELGEHMLANEYFPNDNLKMTPELEEQLVAYYDVLVAYQNVLRDGGELTASSLQSEGSVSIRATARKGSVWCFSRECANRRVYHLINFVNAQTMDWRDDQGQQTTPSLLRDIPVSLTSERQVTAIWWASPDERHGAPEAINFFRNGEEIKFEIPSLKYWDMVVVDFEDQTAVHERKEPRHCELQNLPNPFNASTIIRYSVPHESLVILDVFDIRGRQVKQLVNAFHNSGDYSILFDGSVFSSGHYFLRLRTAGTEQIRRMTLIR